MIIWTSWFRGKKHKAWTYYTSPLTENTQLSWKDRTGKKCWRKRNPDLTGSCGAVPFSSEEGGLWRMQCSAPLAWSRCVPQSHIDCRGHARRLPGSDKVEIKPKNSQYFPCILQLSTCSIIPCIMLNRMGPYPGSGGSQHGDSLSGSSSPPCQQSTTGSRVWINPHNTRLETERKKWV